jgi:glycosyltransferase involved in cell wall biosynthesis
MCPAATLFREGNVCEECIGKFLPWPGVWHACYHNSHLHSAFVALLLTTHRFFGTWSKKIDRFIALTEFAETKFIEGGFPEEKFFISPNFLEPDPGKKNTLGDFVLFVGRLSPEKGLRVLLNAWKELSTIPLKIVGDGPMLNELEKLVKLTNPKQVELLGKKPHQNVLELMKKARLLIFPSTWYEGFPLTIIEAYACGLPVIASRLGSMEDIVVDGETGSLFEPGNPEDLAQKVKKLWDNDEKTRAIGEVARREYEQKYTAKQKYQSLMDIYEKTIDEYR